ncbi:DUF3500 domain-containing protein [Myceligenerans pegani]|uniref:DUF3500 domain-containing protein n=1 Tax=Myceligenerans pegani TaxID=2776917 RepID=A0ABR9N5V6_9MICO|nr:DUF3500 domain-containing protein [Myceligenerans sp. TRM 65318]MBE1879044.1 DUF3500 domain-containing protein [Myceligenerans sp. TRM 65318]MBE3021315.1 DUF3500 domain-containing protein [Myceligenerans sp. TRM 65318]
MKKHIEVDGDGRSAMLRALACTAGFAMVLTGCSGTGDAGSSETDTGSSAASTTSSGDSSDVVALAEAFAATLDDDQIAELNQDYTFENAAAWSNFPQALLTGGGPGGGTARVGLATSTLSDEQWTALEELLAGVTGAEENEGFDEIMQHLEADDYLADNGGGDDYGRGNFYIAFLGEPTDDGTWELQFGGHHLALANTYTDGELAGATPSFRGIEPMDEVEVGGDTVMPEQQERTAFAELLGSFDDNQLAAAELPESYGDILLGPGTDWAFPQEQEGIAASELSDDQKDLLIAAIDRYVGDIDADNAERILAQYEDELDDTHIAYAGDATMESTGAYVRIDGPSVWIEFSMQGGIVLDGAHPHAVWRDKNNDYGGLSS